MLCPRRRERRGANERCSKCDEALVRLKAARGGSTSISQRLFSFGSTRIEAQSAPDNGLLRVRHLSHDARGARAKEHKEWASHGLVIMKRSRCGQVAAPFQAERQRTNQFSIGATP